MRIVSFVFHGNEMSYKLEITLVSPESNKSANKYCIVHGDGVQFRS